jgi:RHS repeat-associated protein
MSLLSSVVEAFYWYDGDGTMVKSQVNGVVTYYAGRHYHKEISDTGETIRKFYTAGSAQIAMRTNGVLAWVLSDHLGSANVTANENGSFLSEERYTAFGELRLSNGGTETPYQYTGQLSQMDEIGLYYYVARWYDPSIMMFTSPDTIVPDPYNPIDWNRYAYVRFNPISNTDPTGHWIDTVLDIGFIAYDIADIRSNGLNWVSGLSLAADVAGALLPAVTGGGLAIRALSHADDVVDAAKAADKIIDTVETANKADDILDAVSHGDDLADALVHSDDVSGIRQPDLPDWPSTPAEMDDILGIPGQQVPDLPTTPGRNKVVWNPSDNIKITYEQHPYHPNAPAFHTETHWHIEWPGLQKHQTYLPGQAMPR